MPYWSNRRDSRSRRSPTAFEEEVHGIHVLLESARIEVLGHEIRGVLRTWDLANLKLLCAHLILQPQVLHVDVPQLTETLAVQDPECSTRVALDFAAHGQPKVGCHCHYTQRLRCALDHRVKFRLCTRKG